MVNKWFKFHIYFLACTTCKVPFEYIYYNILFITVDDESSITTNAKDGAYLRAKLANLHRL